MKLITVPKTVNDVFYEATDGTRFRSDTECQRYEETCECIIKSAFQKISVTTDEYSFYGYGNEEYTIHIIRFEKKEDVETANKFLAFKTADSKDKTFFDESVIGTTQIVSWDYDERIYYFDGTIEDYYEKLKKRIVDWFAPKNEEEVK